MTENRIASAEASNLTNAMTDFSVANQTTDGTTTQKENEWQDTKWTQYLGYYKDEKTPEITAVIDAKSTWVVGKGFKADEITTMLLDTIKGNGYDTFNTLLENAMRTMLLGGNFYAEIIRDDEGNLINLKPLDPSKIKIIYNNKGQIIRFEQTSGEKKVNQKFKTEEIFYLARNRIADEIHGSGIAQKLKLIIDMKNEAMADQRKALHWNVIPRWKFKLKTDYPSEIAAYKAKQDAATSSGENIYEPFDVSEGELISVPSNATLNPMAWIQYLDNLFYEMAGVPKIILGGSGEFTEASAKIAYLAFQQGVEEEQLFLEEQVLNQLSLVIQLEFPASLENELLQQEKDNKMPKDYSKFKKNKPIYLDKKGVVTKAGERSSEVSEKLNIERKQAQEKEKKGERGAVFTQHKKEEKRKKERKLERAKKTKDEMNKRNQEEVQRKNYEIKETIRLNQEKEKKGFDIKEYRERETLGGKAVKTITDLKTTAVLTTALGILSGYGIATGALKIGGGAAGTTGVQGVITHSVTAFGKTQVAQRAITGKVIHQTPKALQKLYSTTPSITKYVTNGKTLSLTKALLTKTFDTIKNPGFNDLNLIQKLAISNLSSNQIQQKQQEIISYEQEKQKEEEKEKPSLKYDPVNLYLKQIGKIPLLTAAEEIQLALKINNLLKLQEIYQNLEQKLTRNPSKIEWATAANLTITSLETQLKIGQKAKNKLIESNLRLVVSIAKRYKSYGLEFFDLIQEGNLGLIRAVEKFDHTKGYKFSTYATWWIRQGITRAIADQSRIIRLPVHLYETISLIKKTTTILSQHMGRKPTTEEIATHTEMTIQKLRFIATVTQLTISLETAIGKEENSRISDLIEAVEETPEDDVYKNLLREDLEEVLDGISPRERDVLRLRYGLDDGRMKTLEEIGQLFDVTRERIRQIEAKALRKLRHPNRNSILKEYVR